MSRASDISDQASEWLIRIESQSSPEVWESFQAWLDAEPRHRAAFVRVRAAWNRMDLLKNLRPANGSIDSAVLAKERIHPASVAAAGWQPGTRRAWRADHIRANRLHWAAAVAGNRLRWVAAAALVAALACWLGMFTTRASYHETGVGGREELTLSDGSTVELNTATALRTRLSRWRRDVLLIRGEALFRVARDPARPFYVTAGSTVVRAVGTEFSVRLRDADHIDVLVAEGRISIGSAPLIPPRSTASLALPQVAAGEEARTGGGALSIQRLPSGDVSRKLAWIGGHLAFRGETLQEAVEEFNRYNLRHLTIAGPSIAELRMGGTFRTTDPDSFVAALQRSFGIQSSREAREIRLIPAGQPGR